MKKNLEEMWEEVYGEPETYEEWLAGSEDVIVDNGVLEF